MVLLLAVLCGYGSLRETLEDDRMTIAWLSPDQIAQGLTNRFVDVHELEMKISIDEEILSGEKPHFVSIGPSLKDRRFVPGASQLGSSWMDTKIRIDGERRYRETYMPDLIHYGQKRGESRILQKGGPRVRTWNGRVGMFKQGMQGSIRANLQGMELTNHLFNYIDKAARSVELNEKDNTYLPGSFDFKTAKVLPSLEMQEGRPCHVVEASGGKDKLWIDVEKEFALVRREIRYPDHSPRQITVAMDWTEAVPSTWLPRRIVRELYGNPNGASSTGSVTPQVRVVLKADFERKNFTDEDFVIDFPPGTHVTDETRMVTYVVPRLGRTPIDEKPFSYKQTAPKRERRAWNYKTFFLINGVIVLLGLLWLGCRRLWKR